MKALIIGFIVFLFIGTFVAPSESVEWKVTNQVTIAWDAPTTMTNGDPVPADESIKYRVYMANASTDPNKTNAVMLGETDQLQYVITLNTEGKYYVGVSAIRVDSTGAIIDNTESAINWSDVNGDQTPNPFGLVHYIPLAPPGNLR